MTRLLVLPFAVRKRCVFFFAFVYVLCVGLVAQLLLIPYCFSEPSALIGLLPNTDATLYHNTAIGLYDAMKTEGWSAWKLYPQGHSLSGVTAAMYYLFGPSPAVMLPFSALAHGCVALGLISIGRCLGFSQRAMHGGALIYILLPTSLLWLVQLNKDIYFILGLVLVMRAWMWLVPPADASRPAMHWVELCVTYLVGVLLIWLTRPYAILITQIALAASLIFFLALRLYFVGRGGLMRSAAIGLVAIVAMTMMTQVIKHLPERLKGEPEVMLTSWNAIAVRYDTPEKKLSQADRTVIPSIVTQSKVTESRVTERRLSDGKLVESKVTESTVTESKVTEGHVGEGSMATSKLFRYLDLLVAQRLFYVANDYNAASRIDVDAIHTIEDLPLYAPRALIVGYVLPTFWQFMDAKPGFSKTSMLVAGLEMLLVNIGFVALIFRLRNLSLANRLALAMLVACSVLLVMVNVYATPNLGTLYRVRFGPLMLLAVLGWAACFELLQARRKPTPASSAI